MKYIMSICLVGLNASVIAADETRETYVQNELNMQQIMQMPGDPLENFRMALRGALEKPIGEDPPALHRVEKNGKIVYEERNPTDMRTLVERGASVPPSSPITIHGSTPVVATSNEEEESKGKPTLTITALLEKVSDILKTNEDGYQKKALNLLESKIQDPTFMSNLEEQERGLIFFKAGAICDLDCQQEEAISYYERSSHPGAKQRLYAVKNATQRKVIGYE